MKKMDMKTAAPLSEILRPQTLQDFVGQHHLLKENVAITNLLHSKKLFSAILWGPPGCGKTTLAHILSKAFYADFVQLSAVNSGIRELRATVATAEANLRNRGLQTLVFIDEIHRYTKTQQDALLPHVERGTIYLMGATTENPSFQIAPALLSRLQLIALSQLTSEEMLSIVRKGYTHLINQHGSIAIDPRVADFILNHAAGDARIALNLVEYSYFASEIKEDGKRALSLSIMENLVQKQAIKFGIDEHYDCASALQKSIRGSDVNASVYWLAKMIAGGEDPRFIARRLIVTASEDVGNADPMALQLAVNAHHAVELLGLPEGRIPLAQATIYLAKAKKSNQAYKAIDKALFDIEKNGQNHPVPLHLKDAHYRDAKEKYGFGKDYLSSHDHPEKKQSFLPDALTGKKYVDEEK